MINLRLQNDQYSQKKIFDQDFKVQEMSNPQKYLPQYQQNKKYQTSAIQDCMVCCGGICIICAIPFGCCGCIDCCCCYTLPTSQAGLVQSFGRFQRLLKPGLNMINPCSQQITMVDLKIKVLNVGRNITMTKDNVKLTIDSSIAFRITNPIVSHYVLGNNQNRALTQLTTSSLRQIIGQYILDNVLNSRMQISNKAKEIIQKNIPPGISIENVFIEEIIIPPEIERDLTSAAKQRRLGQATIINSKADVQTASLMKQSAELLDTKAAMQIRYLQMVTQLGNNGVVLLMGIGANKKGY